MNKRYVVTGENGEYTAIHWPEGTPFELISHHLHNRRYRIEYASDSIMAKKCALIEDVEDLIDKRKEALENEKA